MRKLHSFSCPICDEHFLFSVQDGIEANKEVFLRIVHIHGEKSPQTGTELIPRWQGVIHEKGARNVEGKDDVMRVTYAQGKARREAVQKKTRESAKRVKEERLTR